MLLGPTSPSGSIQTYKEMKMLNPIYCKDCMAFKKERQLFDGHKIGHCRKELPTRVQPYIAGSPSGNFHTIPLYPATRGTDYCGEAIHKDTEYLRVRRINNRIEVLYRKYNEKCWLEHSGAIHKGHSGTLHEKFECAEVSGQYQGDFDIVLERSDINEESKSQGCPQ